MKTNETSEKIYVHVKNDKVTNIWNSTLIGVRDIEYTRTDAFIEKAVKFIKNSTYGYLTYKNGDVDLDRDALANDFRKAMEE